jgi:hypothetical protein
MDAFKFVHQYSLIPNHAIAFFSEVSRSAGQGIRTVVGEPLAVSKVRL